MGFIYGFIFGAMDLEDVGKDKIKKKFFQEEFYCFPIGIIFGCFIGVVNEYLRQEVVNFYYLKLFQALLKKIENVHDPFYETI